MRHPSRILLALSALAALGLVRGLAQDKAPAPAGVDLKKDPRLQVKLTVKMDRPTLAVLLDEIERASGVTLVAPTEGNAEREVFGSVGWVNMPAWWTMKQVALAPAVKGHWVQEGGGYRLVCPLPPPVAADDAPTDLAPRAGVLFWVTAINGGLLTGLVAITLVVRHRRRSARVASGSATDPASAPPVA
jgi:hypothetical protein